ncbi:SusD-like starch-binding protein associating with outer membrane [Dyadobacter jejuensis]|uniref:SusD-like starch-binding protein associating with outer membrane n=1 Tax=Dyadobacter jejuensis TaxID=1082580 RepID=A0A316ACL6_9BACT|nr:SusD/RagB family nutrient-binding outer membrane lipoprotein [Dyadobacter jejuensis]PWJ55322.1 SusD-like starch-binding protein associating with outer membrane [Dyadobacter jejuensis]
MFKKAYIPFILFLSLLLSCTDGFEDLNTDPNRPKEINPGVMLSQLQYRIVNTTIDEALDFTHELMQVDAPRTSTDGGGMHRYVITPGNAVWSNFYLYLTDIEDMYQIADELQENNYKAIALIYKSWSYSILTDLYGDVPYSQANQAINGNFKPTFDKQEAIYPQILQDLETANTLLDDTKALTYGGDMVYKSNTLSGGKNPGIANWKRFCNSLRLRLLLRVSAKEGTVNAKEQITAILANPVQFPVFTVNSQEAIFRYPGTYPFYNPYYNARQVDWRDGTYYTKFFMDFMNQVEDPRRAVWATQVMSGSELAYTGIESGYPTSTEYTVGSHSSYSDGLKTLPQLGVMMTLAEVEFIKAELALKGYSTGATTQQHYERGIAASMNQWGATMPANFIGRQGIAFDASASQEKQLEQVMLQKYYAYLFVDYQSWFEKRRTGYPILPRGTGIPAENLFPERVPYPTYLQSMNPEALAGAVASMGGDDSNIKVWWNQ